MLLQFCFEDEDKEIACACINLFQMFQFIILLIQSHYRPPPLAVARREAVLWQGEGEGEGRGARRKGETGEGPGSG